MCEIYFTVKGVSDCKTFKKPWLFQELNSCFNILSIAAKYRSSTTVPPFCTIYNLILCFDIQRKGEKSLFIITFLCSCSSYSHKVCCCWSDGIIFLKVATITLNWDKTGFQTGSFLESNILMDWFPIVCVYLYHRWTIIKTNVLINTLYGQNYWDTGILHLRL